MGDVSLLKAGLDLVGLAGGPVRPPRVELPEEARQALSNQLVELGVELAVAEHPTQSSNPTDQQTYARQFSN